jgi:TonB family protein
VSPAVLQSVLVDKLKNDLSEISSRKLGVISGLAWATLALLLCLASSLVPNMQAQEARPAAKSARKVVVTVKPEYPLTLKRAGIGGTVRLHAVVLPNGNVSKVEIIGGNPILAESAAKAVMQWKYAPAAWQTNAEVQFDFHP